MSEVTEKLERMINDADEAIEDAESAVVTKAETAERHARSGVADAADRLKKWSGDAQAILADTSDEGADQKEKLTYFGDELMHDLKMARDKL